MSKTSQAEQKIIERPESILNGIACDAWEAFNAMESTKRRHYELLEILDNKKKNYNLDPDDAQKAHLASLLKDHDEQVRRFTVASAALKQADAHAHRSLFVYIGAISEPDRSPTPNTSH